MTPTSQKDDRKQPARSTRWATFSPFVCYPFVLCVVVVTSMIAGCRDDLQQVREIQAQRQLRMQAQSQQDHLGEAFNLLSHLVELNDDQARRQITYHLNRWAESKQIEQEVSPTKMLREVRDLLPEEEAAERVGRDRFHPSDVDHLRDSYLFRRIVEWVDRPQSDDPLLADWLTSMESQLAEEASTKLRTATRLFDWTVRNIAYEPLELTTATPPPPSLPFGMELQGAGYRQTDYKTVWRGTGDSLQRAGVFTQLCRQASIPAFVLATQSETGKLEPWCVGILIGEQVYLFEPELSTYIPGPGQVGIATLEQARKDASVMRRLNVPGFFDYPLSKDDIQQSIALLNVMPEAISPRMKLLESGLTGARRMRVFVDAEALARELEPIAGIAGVRLWDMPLLAEIYEEEIQRVSERDPLIAIWNASRWAMLEAPIEIAQELALGRWRHLHGQFDNDEEENTKGARTIYLAQRAPEFEIEDLNIDVDLQSAYGVRRDLGVDQETFDLQIRRAQAMMREGKRTATYWISLIQYDDGRYDTADNWFSKRVLDESQLSYWEPAARYNLARSLERLDEVDRAVEIYKTDGDPQEHGNRIRARLLTRSAEDN